jgi:hypothetical protein
MSQNEKTKALFAKIPIENLVETNQAEYKVLEALGMGAFYVKPK